MMPTTLADARRELAEAGLDLCWAGADPAERGSICHLDDLVGAVIWRPGSDGLDLTARPHVLTPDDVCWLVAHLLGEVARPRWCVDGAMKKWRTQTAEASSAMDAQRLKQVATWMFGERRDDHGNSRWWETRIWVACPPHSSVDLGSNCTAAEASARLAAREVWR